MVAFLFLFAPTVVLIAVLIMQRFQRRRDRNQGILIERIGKNGRVEPRFSAVNDNAGDELDSELFMDEHSISTG